MEESKNYSCFDLKFFLKFNISECIDYFVLLWVHVCYALKAAVHIEEKRQSEYSADR